MIQQRVARTVDEVLEPANPERRFMTGSEAVKEAILRSNITMAIAYPITPQSESMHLVGDLYAEGYIPDYFRGESEFAVMAQVAGAALGGVRVFTATGGPGTLRAFELFPYWAGSRLPIVCAFFTRGVNAPLSIQPDTIEMAFLLDTGLIMLHAEGAQDLYDFTLRAFAIAEQTDVHIPVGVFADGFFVTHTREMVAVGPPDLKLPAYDPHRSPVPTMDMEGVPVRHMREPFVMKSNYISYAAHASWQQEILAAVERSRKYVHQYLGGLIETENEDADILIMAGGTAVSQSREAIQLAREQGIDVGLVKIKCLRPFPTEEIQQLARRARAIVVPEFNRVGWLAREIRAVVEDNTRVVGAPRVFGGMTMPSELILAQVKACVPATC